MKKLQLHIKHITLLHQDYPDPILDLFDFLVSEVKFELQVIVLSFGSKYSKNNSNFILFYIKDITLGISEPDIPYSIHHIVFLNTVCTASIRQNETFLKFVCKENTIKCSIYFSFLFLPIFIPTYKIQALCHTLELININVLILKFQVKTIKL